MAAVQLPLALVDGQMSSTGNMFSTKLFLSEDLMSMQIGSPRTPRRRGKTGLSPSSHTWASLDHESSLGDVATPSQISLQTAPSQSLLPAIQNSPAGFALTSGDVIMRAPPQLPPATCGPALMRPHRAWCDLVPKATRVVAMSPLRTSARRKGGRGMMMRKQSTESSNSVQESSPHSPRGKDHSSSIATDASAASSSRGVGAHKGGRKTLSSDSGEEEDEDAFGSPSSMNARRKSTENTESASTPRRETGSTARRSSLRNHKPSLAGGEEGHEPSDVNPVFMEMKKHRATVSFSHAPGDGPLSHDAFAAAFNPSERGRGTFLKHSRHSSQVAPDVMTSNRSSRVKAEHASVAEEPEGWTEPERKRTVKLKKGAIKRSQRLARLEKRQLQQQQEITYARKVEQKQQQFENLPPGELSALERVFHQFTEDDLDEIPGLDPKDLVAALREMGLRGLNTCEKQEITKLTREVLSELVEDDLLTPDGTIDIVTFALDVVPRVRFRLTELRSDDMLRRFFQLDKDGVGKLRAEKCIEVARRMGLDQRTMRKVLEEANLWGSLIDFDDFQVMVIRCRELVEQAMLEKMTEIRSRTGVHDETFNKFKQDIVNLFDVFKRYDVDQSRTLSYHEVMLAMGEFGLLPKSPSDRREIENLIKAADENGDGETNFEEFLDLAALVRTYIKEKHRDYQYQMFLKHDRDRNGRLSVQEISAVLADLGCAPRDRKEQEELAALIQHEDKDGNGYIDFAEFQVLSLRIEERLKSMRYDEEVEHALALGFSEEQLLDLRYIFDSLDLDGSTKLDAQEVKQGLLMMKKHVSQEAFEVAFRTLDTDGSGTLDFLEFLDMMRMVRDDTWSSSEDARKLGNKANDLDVRILRTVLQKFGISKTYLTSLGEDELIELFCGFFEVMPEDSLFEKLGISTFGELFELAARQGKTTWTDR